LGSYGVGKTQILAKAAALLKASDRDVEIYNLDTFKTSGQGLLQAYAHKLDIPYYFGKEGWAELQSNVKSKAVKLIDTQGINLKNSQELDWIISYAQKFMFDPVLVVPCDACQSLVAEYVSFAKKFGVRNLILSKMDMVGSLSLPIRLSYFSEIPLAMSNNSPTLSDSLQYLNSEKLLNVLMGDFRKSASFA
jgi:flagellar biosynthesis GTPase FlhF